MKSQIPSQRWQITELNPEQTAPLVEATGLSPLLAQVLINRGILSPDEAQVYVNPEAETLPSPNQDFPDLEQSIDLMIEAITEQEKIMICGDYDADGMTSTALLLRTLRYLGADVDYLIPSRMKEGYGINTRIVEECASNGVGLILTVDNGIAAYDPIYRAVELGLQVIITDHHDLPEMLPPADAILNPKLLPESSPYRGLAGVGVAYILAVATAQKLGKLQGFTAQLLELFTLGTIADLAPLIGVNRRWLKRGLRQLPKSEIPGVQALMQVSGVNDTKKAVKPEDIGFRLGPRINAIGRISDPQTVIELLTTDDDGIALEKAMECEQVNGKRQELCAQIEEEAIAYLETGEIDWLRDRAMVIIQPNWHHGVIGIVASRLVDKFGTPVFIGTYEDEEETQIRGSARGIPEFNVFDSLEYCHDLLEKFGGHKAAGGFSLAAENLTAFRERLSEFAHQSLEPEHLKPLIKIDATADFTQLNPHLYQQVDELQPWGIGNEEPIFLSKNVTVAEQRVIGKNHLKLKLRQIVNNQRLEKSAIAWRWGNYFPLPKQVDIAYKLRENHWQGNISLELELLGFRLPETTQQQATTYDYQGRTYHCQLWENLNELRIENDQGNLLILHQGKRTGHLKTNGQSLKAINVTASPYYEIIKAAVSALKD
ncbi:single-stranded-DNA-specific exonuclease RecJ [Halothece sp. PCC 7418]|uniref:single-stranded-DNA-specific exonuclease RecJ n=1 Tax=Halothece sp. (strain PCC 7418) TaxID=65093 RepID=UPI0002A065FC|nr:single-stranded-DNA-specific exonuclease RecJ [Halothece sp. PCC 7418]AFZ45114.1 single-stranded-DNA-specific exonuclease RecJ [Halothece sp. PCC 7418]